MCLFTINNIENQENLILWQVWRIRQTCLYTCVNYNIIDTFTHLDIGLIKNLGLIMLIIF